MSPTPSRSVFSGAKQWVLFLSLKGRATLGGISEKVPNVRRFRLFPCFSDHTSSLGLGSPSRSTAHISAVGLGSRQGASGRRNGTTVPERLAPTEPIRGAAGRPRPTSVGCGARPQARPPEGAKGKGRSAPSQPASQELWAGARPRPCTPPPVRVTRARSPAGCLFVSRRLPDQQPLAGSSLARRPRQESGSLDAPCAG